MDGMAQSYGQLGQNLGRDVAFPPGTLASKGFTQGVQWDMFYGNKIGSRGVGSYTALVVIESYGHPPEQPIRKYSSGCLDACEVL